MTWDGKSNISGTVVTYMLQGYEQVSCVHCAAIVIRHDLSSRDQQSSIFSHLVIFLSFFLLKCCSWWQWWWLWLICVWWQVHPTGSRSIAYQTSRRVWSIINHLCNSLPGTHASWPGLLVLLSQTEEHPSDPEKTFLVCQTFVFLSLKYVIIRMWDEQFLWNLKSSPTWLCLLCVATMALHASFAFYFKSSIQWYKASTTAVAAATVVVRRRDCNERHLCRAKGLIIMVILRPVDSKSAMCVWERGSLQVHAIKYKLEIKSKNVMWKM